MINSSEKLISLIVERLEKIRPFKIILFGSHAYGQPGNESDIDLLVVLNATGILKSYAEKKKLDLSVSVIIRDIRKQTAIDLIVQTKTMYEKFVELDSMFSQELERNGRVIYEADNQRMAS
ncbi:MAG: nucleotidyltransferase domain-containing protein [Kiritimatiellae bacterium]|nr:nucleotidyltransferase domain-containing protein [Kiritimatiellia bacterium]